MKLLSFTLGLVFFTFFASCSKKESVLSKPIQKDRGSLKITNAQSFIGAVTVGNSFEHTLYLKANGGLDIIHFEVNLITDNPFSFSGGTFPGNGGNCSNTLKSGDVCSIVILFEPDTIASHLARLEFSYQDKLGTKNYSYSLTADSHPILTFEFGTQYDFGNKFIGTSTDLKIKISNTGRVTAENIFINNMNLPFSFKGGTYPGIGGNCSSSLIPGNNCEIVINYSPLTNGRHEQDIVLNYLNAGRVEQNQLELIAWGFREVTLAMESTAGDSFGIVATQHAHTKIYTITHTGGDVTANLLNIINLQSPFSRVGGTCGLTLTIDQGSCTVIIQISTSTSAVWSSPMRLSYFNGLQTVNIDKTLTAETKARPVLSLSQIGHIEMGIVKRGLATTKEFIVSYQSGELPATEIAITGFTSNVFNRVGGTCGASLSSGSCSIIMQFAPDIHSQWSENVYFVYNNTIATLNEESLTFSGASEAKLNISPTPYTFATTVVGQTSASRNFTVYFEGGVAATNLSGDFENSVFHFSNGGYPGTTSALRCLSSLISGQCTISLSFSPTLATTYSNQKFTLAYHNGVEEAFLEVNLSGTGSPVAQIVIDDADFGSVEVHNAKALAGRLRVRNTSSVNATSVTYSLPNGFKYNGDKGFPGLNGNCSTSLGGNGTCYLDVIFNPSIAGNFSGLITANYNDGTGANTGNASASLQGSAFFSNHIFLSSFNEVSFNSQYVGANSQVKNITLFHGGGDTSVDIISKSLSNTDYTIQSDNCPNLLMAGQSCVLTVAFTPQSVGVKEAVLLVEYEVSGTNFSTTRNYKATASAPSVLTPNVGSYNFGQIPIGEFRDVTLTINRIGANATSVSRSLTGSGFSYLGGSFPGTGGTCSTSSTWSMTNCTVVLRFQPNSVGSLNGLFRVTYNNGFQTTTMDVNLQGEVIPTSNLVFAQGVYDFGQIIQTTKSERTITLTNTGTLSLSDFTVQTIVNQFNFKGGSYPGTGGTCATSLNVSQSCTLVLEFAPTTVGIKNHLLTIDYNNGYENVSATSTLTGEGLAQAILSLSETNPYHFGTVNPGGFINQVFNITNAGSVSATDISLNFSHHVFGYLGGNFPGTGGTCSTILASGQVCSVVVNFSPSVIGSYNATMTLNYQDGLRLQNEYKQITGESSVYYLKNYLMGLLEKNLFEDMLIDSKYFLSDGSFYSLIKKKFTNLTHKKVYAPFFFNDHYAQAMGLVVSGKEFEEESCNEWLLIGNYLKFENRYSLIGYDRICAKSAALNERYIAPR
jgi:hypothetical protein